MVSDPRLRAPGNPVINEITADLQGPQQAPQQISTPQQTALQEDAFSGGLSDTDLKAALDGNVIPVLQATIRMINQELESESTAPNKDDYQYPEDYAADLAKWRNDGRLALADATMQLFEAKNLSDGIITLDDGTLITSDMLNSDDPAVAAQAKAAWENRSRAAFNNYNDLMNQAGLDQWKVNLEGATFENDRRQAEFTNAVTKFRENTDWDTLNLARASDAINRELSGMAESRSRADLRTRAALEAAPYATGGKTEFTADDFGAITTKLARQAGIPGDQVLVRFPTSVNIDPESILAEYDARFGVGQGLPAVPGLTTDPSMLPALPQFQGGPTPPQMGMPQPYVPAALPPGVPASPQEAAMRQRAELARQAMRRLF